MIPSGIAGSYKPGAASEPQGFTFSSNYKSLDTLLTNDNKTAELVSGGGRYCNVACHQFKETDTYYFEVFIDSLGATGNELSVGVGTWSSGLSRYLGSTGESTGYACDGRVINSGVSVAALVSYAAGDTIGVAVDCDNRTIRFRKNAGVWSNAQNIPTGQPVMPMVQLYGLGAKVTLHTTASEFQFTPYGSYGVWMANSPPTPARYWRYYKLAGDSIPGLFGVPEWQLYETLGGDNIAGEGTLSASDSYFANPPALAVDGSDATFWSTNWNSFLPNYIACDFGAGDSKAIVRSVGTQRKDTTDGIPTDVCLVYSYDNTVFYPAAGAGWYSWPNTQDIDLIVNT